MSFVAGNYEGSKVEAPQRRSRMTDREIRRLSSAQMYAQKLKGWSSAEIAVYFRLTPRMVNMELAAIPPKAKANIEALYRRGEISVA